MWTRNIRIISAVLLTAAIALAPGEETFALCHPGRFINPITDVCWSCIFPVKIGGVTIVPGMPDVPDAASAPLCACPFPPPIFWRIGIPVSFWEPARYIETVKDPYCFPSLGLSFSNPAGGFLGGGNDPDKKKTFQQAHYFIFPVWTILEMFTDSVCVELSGFDVAYMSEVDPICASDDLLCGIINPESVLFANPVAQMACMADSVASNVGYPLDFMPWCFGSWGSAYPFTANSQDGDYTQANAGIAAKTLYKMARLLMVCDPNSPVTLCFCTPTPILIKHNYRFQIAMPVPDPITCHPIGRSSLIWGPGKNPPFAGLGTPADNFMWIIFRKHSCCSF